MNSTLELTATNQTQGASHIGERAAQLPDSVASPATSDTKTELLSLHRLVKRYGELNAVNELSLTLGRGEVFGFLGPNGAGKTSTIRMLCGLTRPSTGYGTVLGYDIWRDRFEVRSLLGYVPQQFSLYPDLTVLENLWFFASAYRVPRSRANCQIQTLLSQLDLFPVRQKRAGQLSGGLVLDGADTNSAPEIQGAVPQILGEYQSRSLETLFQLQVTPMRRSAIIIGKILPYLFIALVVELVLFTLGQHHFHAEFHNPALLLALSLVFLLSTSGLGALISSFSRTQTQAIQFSVFFLLPVFLLSGAFAPVSQLPSVLGSFHTRSR